MQLSNSTKLEKLIPSLILQYVGDKDRQGRVIKYIYSREGFNDLNIKRDNYDNSQFISVGDILILEGYKCKVVNFNFKMLETLHELNNTTSKDEPMSTNCQIRVFVERLNSTT